jgi:hypothetical protein
MKATQEVHDVTVELERVDDACFPPSTSAGGTTTTTG